MKTSELVALLAADTEPTKGNAPEQRFVAALCWSTPIAGLMMFLLLGLRQDLAQAIYLPMFWFKFVFVGSLAAAGFVAVSRLARPGGGIGVLPGMLALPVVALWGMAAVSIFQSDATGRVGLFLGKSWAVCPFLIALLSAPVFLAVMRILRGLAPTRLRLAGAAAGLLSGSTGAFVYCLHCPEMDAPFLGFWYVLGILIPTVIGALWGRSLLRW